MTEMIFPTEVTLRGKKTSKKATRIEGRNEITIAPCIPATWKELHLDSVWRKTFALFYYIL